MTHSRAFLSLLSHKQPVVGRDSERGQGAPQLAVGYLITYTGLVTKLRHHDDCGVARFVTFSCYRCLSGLDIRTATEILVEQLNRARAKHRFKILGYVFMPNHVHLVLDPPDGMKLGLVVGEIKSKSAREFFARRSLRAASTPNVFWQRRCYDHNCRTTETVLEKINYCHANPVKRGLVDEPGKWKWSSYNWYHGKRDVPLQIDGFSF